MLIYRGDAKGEAKMYRTEGIMTRLMNGGNPATVDAVGLWEVSRAHVRPENGGEQRFLATTPFLSFSENRDRAEYYAKGGRAGRLVVHTEPFGEDTIIFELEIEGMKQDGQEGVFVLDYPCDYSLVEPQFPGQDGLDQAAAVSCEFCAPDNKHFEVRVDGNGRLLHRLQLIRVATLLRNHPERQRYAGALDQAEREREWLVYPMDYVHRLRGFSARVPRAQIWTAHRHRFAPETENPASS